MEAVNASEQSNLISMVTTNRNLAVVIDSDRKAKLGASRRPPMALNATKKRIKSEVEEAGGMIWITYGKEIENYTPKIVWERMVGAKLGIKNDYVDIPNVAEIKRVSRSKVELAHKVTSVLSRADIYGHLDLNRKLHELISHIRRWNSIEASSPIVPTDDEEIILSPPSAPHPP